MSSKYEEDYQMILDFINLYKITNNNSRSLSDRKKALELQKITLEILPYPETREEEEIRDKMKTIYQLSRDSLKDTDGKEKLLPLFSPLTAEPDSLPKTLGPSKLDTIFNKMTELKKDDKPEKERIRKTLSEIRELEKENQTEINEKVGRVLIYFKNRNCPVCQSVDLVWENFVEKNVNSGIIFRTFDILEEPRIFDIYGVNYPSIVLTEPLPLEYEVNYDVDLTGYNLLPYIANDNKLIYREMLSPITYDNLVYMLD